MADAPDWWAKPRNVSICVDTRGWFDPFAAELAEKLVSLGDHASFVRAASEVQADGIAFYLSCTRLTPFEVLERNRRNIVVHASALPHGRGFAPVVWQVLEGRTRIPLTMIEAAVQADSGDILLQEEMVLDGTELNDEIRSRMGRIIQKMCLTFLDCPKPPVGRPQVGEASWYRRRAAEDSRLDPHRTIADQFELLRVVDNDRYPAFFDYRGRRYILRIEAEKDE